MISEVYLLSSLPALSFGNHPPISEEEFDVSAKMELSKHNYRLLEEVSIKISECLKKSGLSRKVFGLLEELNGDISSLRTHRNGKQIATSTNILPKDLLKENPLNREMLTMEYLWGKIDEIENGKSFTMSEVVAYKLKLQILHRLASFKHENGSAIFDSILMNADNMIKK